MKNLKCIDFLMINIFALISLAIIGTGGCKKKEQTLQQQRSSNAANEESIYSFWRQCEDSERGFLGFKPKSAEVIAIYQDGHIEGYAMNLGIIMLKSACTVSNGVLSVPKYKLTLAFAVHDDILTMKTGEGETMKYQRLSGSARDEFIKQCKPESIPEEELARTGIQTTSHQLHNQSATSKLESEKQPAVVEAVKVIPKKDEPIPLPTQDQKDVTPEEVQSHRVLYQEGIDVNFVKDGKSVTQRIIVYGVAGLRFPVGILSVDHRARLTTTVIVIESAIGGFLIPEENSAVPINMGFNKSAKYEISFFTHTINTTWKFAKAKIRFDSGDSIYESEKAGATISFTDDGIKMDGIRKILSK